MIEQVYKKPNRKGVEEYKYFSAPFLDLYYPKRKNVIKNYILEAESKSVK
jgi:hypothetical protein